MSRAFRLPALLAAALFAAAPAAAATPPAQPKAGLPGGNDNPDAEVVKRAVGHAGAVTYAFHMAGSPAGGPAGAPAGRRPVAVLFHAWGAVNPIAYGGWIDHLARRGWLVLVPGFQEVGRTRPPDASAVAAALVRDALATLGGDATAAPDTGRVAFIGHSAGSGIALNVAADGRDGLPRPKLILAVMPGGVASDEKSRGIVLADLSRLDPATDLVTMVGDREAIAAERLSRRLLRETSSIPVSRKLFLRAASDDHGFPAMSATLASPASPKEGYEAATIKVAPEPPVDPRAPKVQRPRWSADMVLSGEQTVLLQQLGRNVTDTLDYLAYWKTFDMAADAAFAGQDLLGLKGNPALADMGRWSDGWPVRRMAVETPREAPATTAANPPATPAAAPISAKMPVTRRRPPGG